MLDRPGTNRRQMRILLATPWRQIRSLRQTRLRAVWLGAAVIAVCLACARPAQGLLFSYTHIADDTPDWVDAFSGRPAINGSGDVAFYSAYWYVYPQGDPQWEIYVGNGSLPAARIVSSGGYVGTLDPESQLSINDQGTVAFRTSTWWAEQRLSAIVGYNPDGGGATIASVSSDDDLIVNVAHPSINNAGAVAFMGFHRLGTWHSEPQSIMSGAGGPPKFDAGASGLGFDLVGPPSVRRSGPAYEVAFTAKAEGPVARSAVYKVSGLSPTTIVHTDHSDFHWVAYEAVSIDDLGRVAFVGLRGPAGVRGIYIGDGGPIVTYADSTGGYAEFGPVANSTMGAAFEAQLDTGVRGVYAGPNPITDKVIQVGDSLPGYPSKVKWVSMGHEGYNNAGQVAMYVRFEDDTDRIIRADPLGSWLAPEGDMALAVLSKFWAITEQTVVTPAEVSLLGLDYLFMTTEGVLEVLVNDVNVARIPAPGAIADDFTRLEIPIDPRALFPDLPSELTIAIRLDGEGMETGLLVDNVEFPGLVDGNFQTGTLQHWQTEVTDGGAIGLALAPPGRVVPEPATAACLAMVAVGLGGYIRRRRKA